MNSLQVLSFFISFLFCGSGFAQFPGFVLSFPDGLEKRSFNINNKIISDLGDAIAVGIEVPFNHDEKEYLITYRYLRLSEIKNPDLHVTEFRRRRGWDKEMFQKVPIKLIGDYGIGLNFVVTNNGYVYIPYRGPLPHIFGGLAIMDRKKIIGIQYSLYASIPRKYKNDNFFLLPSVGHTAVFVREISILFHPFNLFLKPKKNHPKEIRRRNNPI